MDFSNYTLADLKVMLAELPAEIQRRETEERAKTFADLEKLAKERGYNLADLVASQKTESKKVKSPVPAKFRNPDNQNQTWTGRGKTPKWMKDVAKEKWCDYEIK